MQGFGLMIEELDAGAVRIALRGELDLAHAYTFDEELRRVEDMRPTTVVLDLRKLTFLDSCGLARLLAARRRARRSGHRLLLVRGPATIQRLFALSAVDEAFEMVSELPEALTAASGHPPA
ncbi:anti-anti-sigma factor [Solirubrobacter pauli]|uniref:Anti-sigma factor antagonist n=1 Tax=Solirubrobacter pauli TaxID=166793 RepID=A0A660KZR3_9ACTN|nr:STAS domain-containing protein [Solirubrobacter pauli]RKQ86658.1 anti-anti-sigma factor [Solirubrobacter pauli]